MHFLFCCPYVSARILMTEEGGRKMEAEKCICGQVNAHGGSGLIIIRTVRQAGCERISRLRFGLRWQA
jgi:hypothetical protein